MDKKRLVECLNEIQKLVSECLAAANESEAPTRNRVKQSPSAGLRGTSATPDFRLPIRAFMKKYAIGLNGQQKFALVLAFFSKGAENNEIPLETIRAAWNKMKGLLGKFNTAYATWAKDHGWVDSTKPRVYVLLAAWKEILNDNA